MILNFDSKSSYYSVTDFSGEVLNTTIPATRDWKSEVVVMQGVTPNYYTTIKDGFITIIFDSYLEGVDVEVYRSAELRPPLLQKIFTFAYATSWLDGFIEAIQDKAIRFYLNGQGRYLFAINRIRTWLPDLIVNTLDAAQRVLDFLFGNQTIGLISQCPERPNKQAVSERPIFIMTYDQVEIDYFMSVSKLSDLGEQDKNSGLTFLGNNEFTLIKSHTIFDSSGASIILYKSAYEGIHSYYVVPPVNSASLLIGNEEIELSASEEDSDITLSLPSGVTHVKANSLQPLAIKINGELIPMKIVNKAPTLPVISGCGTGEDGTEITIANWLN